MGLWVDLSDGEIRSGDPGAAPALSGVIATDDTAHRYPTRPARTRVLGRRRLRTDVVR
jgi:hypothetical protein